MISGISTFTVISTVAVLYAGGWLYFTNEILVQLQQDIENNGTDVPPALEQQVRSAPTLSSLAVAICTFFLWPLLLCEKVKNAVNRWRRRRQLKSILQKLEEALDDKTMDDFEEEAGGGSSQRNTQQ